MFQIAKNGEKNGRIFFELLTPLSNGAPKIVAPNEKNESCSKLPNMVREFNNIIFRIFALPPPPPSHHKRQPQTGKRPHWKMTSACLASQSYTELGPAQPQLVLYFVVLVNLTNCSLQLYCNYSVLVYCSNCGNCYL